MRIEQEEGEEEEEEEEEGREVGRRRDSRRRRRKSPSHHLTGESYEVRSDLGILWDLHGILLNPHIPGALVSARGAVAAASARGADCVGEKPLVSAQGRATPWAPSGGDRFPGGPGCPGGKKVPQVRFSSINNAGQHCHWLGRAESVLFDVVSF